MTVYLADSSIWAWAGKGTRPDIQAKLASRYEAGEVATCAPVILEAMHGPRTSAEYRERFETIFAPLRRLPLDDSAAERALDVQLKLSARTDGNHRRPAIDFLIAAIAEAAGPEVALWCFDRDLEVICEHTGQPIEAETFGDRTE